MVELAEKILAPVVAEAQWTLPPEDWPKIECLATEDDEPVDRSTAAPHGWRPGCGN